MFQYIVVLQAAIALPNEGCEGSDTKCAFNFLKHTWSMWNKITSQVQFRTELAWLTLALQFSILLVTVHILKKRVLWKHAHAAKLTSADSSDTTQHLKLFLRMHQMPLLSFNKRHC